MPKKSVRSVKQKNAWKKLPKWVKFQIRNSPLSKWAAKIRREFSYQCSWCSNEKKLEAHHIYQKHQFKKMKLDVDNGILLCQSCHDKIHSILSVDSTAYFQLISTLLASRKKIKSLKKRNISDFPYQEFIAKDINDALEFHQKMEIPVDLLPKKKKSQK